MSSREFRESAATARAVGAALLLCCAGCAGDGSDVTGAGTSPTDFSGFYRGVQVNPGGSCSPTPLPAATTSDTSQYLPAGVLAAETFEGWGRVTQSGSALTFVFSDSLGRNPAPLIAGVIQPDGSFTQSRSLVLGREALREGGHQFVIEQRQTAVGKFERADGGLRWTSAGIFTYRFHDGGSVTGPVFTTCTRTFTWIATRVAS